VGSAEVTQSAQLDALPAPPSSTVASCALSCRLARRRPCFLESANAVSRSVTAASWGGCSRVRGSPRPRASGPSLSRCGRVSAPFSTSVARSGPPRREWRQARYEVTTAAPRVRTRRRALPHSPNDLPPAERRQRGLCRLPGQPREPRLRHAAPAVCGQPPPQHDRGRRAGLLLAVRHRRGRVPATPDGPVGEPVRAVQRRARGPSPTGSAPKGRLN
jgi:hypothetical protein